MRKLHSGQRGICSTIKGYIYDKYQPRWVPYHKRQVGQLQQEYRGTMLLRYQQVDHVRTSIVVPLFLGTYQQWSYLHINCGSSVSGNLSADWALHPKWIWLCRQQMHWQWKEPIKEYQWPCLRIDRGSSVSGNLSACWPCSHHDYSSHVMWDHFPTKSVHRGGPLAATFNSLSTSSI